MKNRSIGMIIVLSILTGGIYLLYLLVNTKTEMKALGADIPTAWLIIVPFVNFWWYWKYSAAVEQITNQQVSTLMSFLLLIFLGGIGSIILQTSFNKLGSGGLASASPAATPAQPDALASAAPQPASFAPTPQPTPLDQPTQSVQAPAMDQPQVSGFPEPDTTVNTTPNVDPVQPSPLSVDDTPPTPPTSPVNPV